MTQRFTALTLAVCALFTSVVAGAQSANKDELAMEHYTLTMPDVTKFWATFGSFAKLAKEHPELKDALENDPDKHEDLAAVEKRTASVPQVKAAILDNGLTVHDFIMIQLSLFQAALASAMVPPGPERTKKALEVHINPANLDFVDQHKGELQALQAKYLPQDAGK